MPPPRLSDLARLTGAPLDEIALAIAAEFKPVNRDRARARLDLLAESLDPGLLGDPSHRADELVDRLARRAGFEVEREHRPRALMLDEVLADRAGHPLALAVVYAGVARRAGFELYPVGDSDVVLLGDPHSDPPIAIDPVPGGRELPERMRWLCSHLVALRLLDAIGGRFLRRGDLAAGIRAAELRLALPLNAELRAKHEYALAALRARLN